MIVFDLACGSGHVFEAWFGSSDDYEGQKARGLVSCPVCGSDTVDKAVMAPRVAPKGNAGPPVAEAKAMLAKMAALQQKMLADASYVGRDFATQARAMHEGDRPQAAIYGEVTAPEAKSLIEDGVPVAPLPIPVRPPGQDN
ncbi:MAG: DUF1178 family protein [Sphingomonas fennica]